MKLIDGDKLVHTDNSEDILQHFGTKGMKWGVRKFVRNAGMVGKILGNKAIHPALTGRAQDRAMNDYIDARKAYQWNKRKIKDKHSAYEDQIGKMDISKREAAKLENKNAKKERKALKSLKKEFRSNYGTTAHLNRQYQYIQEAKAAKKKYKADKKAAKDSYVKSIYGE